MKILLSVYACEPGQGSEEGIGWNTVLAIAQYHEAWVLTRTFCRSAIEAELANHPVPNLHFIYLDPLGWSEDWKGKQGAVQLHYYLWQVQAYFIGRALQNQVNFDLIHHVTYTKFWSPSFLAFLSPPFIWGPVGGGEAAPKSFWKAFSPRAKSYEILRDLAQHLGEYDPFTRLTARRSAIALAATQETESRIRQLKPQNLKIVSSVGLSAREIDSFAQYPMPSGQTIRFVSVGRLLHWKGTYLGLQAFAMAQIEKAEYWVIGEGPERASLEQLAEQLKISDRVKFLGSIPRDSMSLHLAQCHVLVHPSLHESGGFVCAEMMAAGRPVICLDLGGPAMQVTNETGIKIPADTPEQAVKGLAIAMSKLANNAELRVQMGKAAQARVREIFTWEVKGKYFAQLYQEIALTESKELSISR